MTISINHSTDSLSASSNVVTLTSTGGVVLSRGNNNVDKPEASQNLNGLIRYNTDTSSLEAIINGSYVDLLNGNLSPVSDISFNNFKLTHLAPGISPTDAVNLQQSQNASFSWAGTASGTANALVVNLSPAPSSYTLGFKFTFVQQNDNTSAVTIAVGSLSAIAIKKTAAGSLVDLEAGDLKANGIYQVSYDGSVFRLINQPPTSISPVADFSINSHKIINLSDGSSLTDAATLKQVQSNIYNYAGLAGGTENSLSLTCSPSFTTFIQGQRIVFKAAYSNSTAVSLTLNGVSGLEIRKLMNGNVVALESNDIKVNGFYELIYDGTYFVMFETKNVFETLTVKNQGIFYDGSLSTPSLKIGNTGIYSTSANSINLSTNNILGLTISSTQIVNVPVKLQVAGVDVVSAPTMTGNSGKAVVTNGTTTSWSYPDHLSSVSGTAPSYSARAWVTFDGTSANPVILGSGNISGITKVSTGVYTIFFTTPLPSDYYSFFGTARSPSGINGTVMFNVRPDYDYTKKNTALQIKVLRSDSSAVVDSPEVSLVMIG